jgi:hypothetical protein
MNKKLLVVGVAVAVLVGVGGAAFAYFSTTGGGTGSAAVGNPSPLLIDQLGGTAMYNSTIDPSTYDWSYAFYATGANELGNKVELANGGGVLSDVVVAMVNFNPTSGPLGLTFNVYDSSGYSGPGTQPGSLIATDSQTFNVPAAPNGGYGSPTCIAARASNPNSACGLANFNITFDNFTPSSVVLPGTIVYGITYNNWPQPADTSGVNVQLSNEATQISVGSDADPGYLFVSTENGTDGATGGSGGEITCSDVTSTFGEYSTAVGSNGCGETTTYTAPFPSIALVPAVEIDTSSMSDLYPGGPAQPISFSVTNPGSIPVALNSVAIAVAYDPANFEIETVPGYTSTDVGGCYEYWFTITQPPAINGSVAAGQTWVDSPSGASIVMPQSPSDQDACEGATVGLTFTAS